MIVWLASYPKSGNTWVRIFLNSLLFSDREEININNIKIEQFPNKRHFNNISTDLSNIEEILENSINAQNLINLDKKIKFLKTHSANWRTKKTAFTDKNNTHGVIHIVRDPRNIITSLKNHFNKNTYKQTLEFMRNERKFIGTKDIKNEFDVPTLISSWSNHYKSWKNFDKNYLLIKYEDLLYKKNEFLKIINYLEKNTENKFKSYQIDKALNDCNFENLKKQEIDKGFIEAPKLKNQNFFYLGPKNNWEKLLDSEITKEIENYFKIEMKELNYL